MKKILFLLSMAAFCLAGCDLEYSTDLPGKKTAENHEVRKAAVVKVSKILVRYHQYTSASKAVLLLDDGSVLSGFEEKLFLLSEGDTVLLEDGKFKDCIYTAVL